MDENKFSISAYIKAIFSKDQVEKEADNAAKTAQKELDKNELKLDLQIERAQLQKQLELTRSELKMFKKQWDKELELQARLNEQDIKEKLKGVDTQLKKVWETAEKAAWDDNKWMWKFMKNLKNTAIWTAVIWFTKKLADTLINLWNAYKDVADQFDRFTGNSEVTKDLLEQLNNFSISNWLDLNNVRETAWELLKLWVNAEDVIPTMQQLGDISAWTWASMEDLADIMWDINKEWKLTTDTFNDLVEAWVPIWDQLASDLWLTVDEVKKLASEWKITDEQVSTAFQHMTEEWGAFFWAMAEKSTSFAAQMNSVRWTLQVLWENIANGVMPAFEHLIWDVNDTANALTETSQTGWSAMWVIQKWLYIVIEVFRGLIRIIQNFWTLLGSVFSSAYTIVVWFWTDVGNIFVKLFSAETWIKMWNNLAYWIQEWVNKAIDHINNLAKLINKLPWISVWTMDKLNLVQKQDIWFDFSNTSNAIKWATQAMKEATEDIGEGWLEFWRDFQEGWNSIWKATEEGVKKTNATLRDMINENTKTTSKWAKDQTKAILDQKKEELKKLRDLKIQEVQNSTASEHEKQVKLLDIYNRYKDELIKLEGKTNDELLKSAEEYLKEYQKEFEKASKADQDEVSKSIKKVEDYNEKIGKLADKRSEYKNKATKSIREINNSIKELDDDFDNDIAERYNKVIEQITKLWDKEWMKWIWDYMSLDQLQNWGSGSINWIKIDEAIEYKKLLEERDFLEKNLTQEQRNQADILNDQTESERLMLEYQKKRAALMEEKAIYEAFNNQWDLDNIWKKAIQIEGDIVKYYDKTKDQYVEITDFKNQELARELENQQSKLTTEYEQLETAKNNEVELIESTSKKILARWQSDTKAYKGELNTRLDAVRSYVESVKSLLASIPTSYRAYWWTMNSWITMVGENWPEAIVARQSSYVQPRNAVQNYSNVYNNQNSLSINWIEIWSFNSVEDLLNWLKPYLTRRN